MTARIQGAHVRMRSAFAALPMGPDRIARLGKKVIIESPKPVIDLNQKIVVKPLEDK